MLAKKLTSLQHPLVKQWTDLRKNRKEREQSQALLIVGEKMVRECPLPLQVLLTLRPASLAAQEHILVTEPILKKITGLEEPDGFAAVVSMPKPQDLSDKQFLLIADQLSDPGNLGTLIRTALALGWDGIIATPGTVDLFNDKALRSAKGATFHLPFCQKTPEEIVSWVQQKKLHLFLADLSGKPLAQTSFRPPLALILSCEAKGPSNWSKRISKSISIPMQPQVESLNVGAAGAILLYAMRCG